jgi:hypothetical protein
VAFVPEAGPSADVSEADRWEVRTSTRDHRRRPGGSSLLSQGRGGTNICDVNSVKHEKAKGSRPAREGHQKSCSAVRFDVGGVEGQKVSEEGLDVGESMPKKAVALHRIRWIDQARFVRIVTLFARLLEQGE